MGTNPKVCFLGDIGQRSLVVSQGRKVGFFFKNQGIIFLVVWDGWLEKGGWYFYFYFFGV
jgi:hypothetical protein